MAGCSWLDDLTEERCVGAVEFDTYSGHIACMGSVVLLQVDAVVFVGRAGLVVAEYCMLGSADGLRADSAIGEHFVGSRCLVVS